VRSPYGGGCDEIMRNQHELLSLLVDILTSIFEILLLEHLCYEKVGGRKVGRA